MNLSDAIPLALKARSLDIQDLHAVLAAILFDGVHKDRAPLYRREIVEWLCDNPETVFYDGQRWALRASVANGRTRL